MRHYGRRLLCWVLALTMLCCAFQTVRAVEAKEADKLVDDRDPGITYSTGWSQWSDAVHYNSTITYTNTVGASMEYEFEGTGIAVYGQKTVNSPYIEVYLDGTKHGEADMYSSVALGEDQALVYQIEGLAAGKHVLKVVTSSKKNPSAGTYQVALDYLKITGAAEEEPDTPDLGEVIYENDFSKEDTGKWNCEAETKLELVTDAELGRNVLKVTPSKHNENLELVSAGMLKDGSISFKIKGGNVIGLGPMIRSQGGENCTFFEYTSAWWLGDDSKGKWNQLPSAAGPKNDVWYEVSIVFEGDSYAVQFGDFTWKGTYTGLNNGQGYFGIHVVNGDKNTPFYVTDLIVTDKSDYTISPDDTEHDNTMKLWYEYPASNWETEALPLGNGYMGAMVFGDAKNEVIQINDKTLWIGGPGGVEDYTGGIKEGAYENLEAMREALRNGDTASVNALAGTLAGKDLNTNGWGAYQNIGDINLEFAFPKGSRIEQYRRELDIMNGIAKTFYQYNGSAYEREYLVSYPDNVMAFKLNTDEAGSLDFCLNPEIDTVYPSGQPDTPPNVDPSVPIKEYTRKAENGKITVQGHTTENGMKFEVQYQVVTDGAVTNNEDGTITVSGAKEAVIYVATGTDYKNESSEWTDLHNPPDYRGEDPHEDVSARIAQALEKGYDAIRADHVEDVSSIMKRVNLDIGQEANDTPTNELVKNYKTTGDKNLEVLLFQYGRYLLLSSSRDGSLPANLQGVWNNSNKPAWSGDYHFNVNIQMNYWPAFVTNLSETGTALVDYVESLVAPGRLTAAEHHGITDGGWTIHTINNPFGMTAPGWSFYWGWSPASNAWICQNLWDYYQFTQDKEILEKQIYPIMREAAEFWTKNLVDDGNGGLVSSPTYSPEHGPITEGNTYEQSLVYQLMQDTILAAQELGVDQEFCQQLEEIKSKLHPYEIGEWGQIKEWREEDEWTDRGRSQGVEFGHRHLSHLLGLYPGNQITKDTPELLEAAKVSATDRTDGGTGWSKAQKVSIWARLRDGDHALKVYSEQLKNNVYGNLFSYHPPFQIDGNLGATAGVAEMLLQSHAGYIDMLPALPSAWDTGHVDGLVGRGNFVVSMDWEQGKLTDWEITSQSGNECKVFLEEFQNSVVVDEDGNKVASTYEDGILTFATQEGKTYFLAAKEDEGDADKTRLQSLIHRADKMLPNEAKYVAANWPELVEKLAEGQKVYENEKATQEEVDKAVDDLLGAILAQRFKADKSNLEELLKKAGAIDTTLYTAETVQVFHAALANAKAVMADASLSESDQQIVEAAVKALADAKDGLKLADNGNAGSTDGDKDNSGSQDNVTAAPKTGDSAPVGLWVSLAGIVMCMAALTAGKKKRIGSLSNVTQ